MIATSNRESLRSRVRLRMTEAQHATVYQHLFPGDGYEAVAVLVCGRGGTPGDEVLLVHTVVPIPHDECAERTPVRVTWSTDRLRRLLEGAAKHAQALVKVHSHPGGWLDFSEWDDSSDRALFPSIYGWLDSNRPHLSLIMMPTGLIRARAVSADGTFSEVESVAAIGTAIRELIVAPSSAVGVVHDAHDHRAERHTVRTRQAFGDGTTDRLGRMSIGVVGCSGTGSWVVELLARLGVGQLTLVDPDRVEHLNLNRIVHATTADAETSRPKVEVMTRAVASMGTGIHVDAYVEDVITPRMVRRLSRCDAIIGCVDSIDARDVLGRISTYYILPYVDVGVRLVADGHGGISHVVGSAQYVHPNSPSLLDRGLYTAKQLADAGLRRSDPAAYAEQVKAKYISNADEDRPAVASVNAFYASLAVNELLARLHSFRDDEPALGVTISLSQLRIILPDGGPPSPGLVKRTGRGDASPLLGLPALSESISS
ncbi:MAG: thiamine biosynthesis protein ThiF [Gemmatimonadetes bacterium]|nr:thiamine biosynthesis protein ThiF [Gemmatimonadota bacterium]